jgi:hypothetical protein
MLGINNATRYADSQNSVVNQIDWRQQSVYLLFQKQGLILEGYPSAAFAATAFVVAGFRQ